MHAETRRKPKQVAVHSCACNNNHNNLNNNKGCLVQSQPLQAYRLSRTPCVCHTFCKTLQGTATIKARLQKAVFMPGETVQVGSLAAVVPVKHCCVPSSGPVIPSSSMCDWFAAQVLLDIDNQSSVEFSSVVMELQRSVTLHKQDALLSHINDVLETVQGPGVCLNAVRCCKCALRYVCF